MRADRLISLILTLHAKGRMTADVLAAQLEVSERTIYRDLDALSAAGIPVYTQPGQNGGIFLDEHYRVALTGLSLAEVRSLFVSSGSGPLKDLGLSNAVEYTLLKLLASLPYNHRAEAQRMRQQFHIDPKNWFQIVEISPHLPLLQQAVLEDRVVLVDYRPVEGEFSQRELEAYALVAKANLWYLVGRKAGGEMRNYRVSRFRQVNLTDNHFARDAKFDLAAYWDAACRQFETASEVLNPQYRTVIRVKSDMLWYFPAYLNGRHDVVCQDDGDGWATVHARFDSVYDARMRVMGLGTAAEVVEPAELRKLVIDTARAIVAATGDAR